VLVQTRDVCEGIHIGVAFHATILEMNVESYRRRAALNRKRGPGRPSAHTTIKEST
jgi:hypothetical protein